MTENEKEAMRILAKNIALIASHIVYELGTMKVVDIHEDMEKVLSLLEE